MEFHISQQARKRYKFEDSLFSFNGNVIFANFHAARKFAQLINDQHDLSAHPELAIKAGQINALGLIDEIFHHIVSLYRSQHLPSLYHDLTAFLIDRVGRRTLNTALRAFTREFPPPTVFQEKLSLDAYLEGEADGIPNQAGAIEELLMLWLVNKNPASEPYCELFSDKKLAQTSAYELVCTEIRSFFETQARFGPDNQNLVDMLRSPAIAVPHSLQGQLDYIRSRWSNLLGHYLLKLLGSLNMISEEEHPRGLGPGPMRIPVYGEGAEIEDERFSPDADWMPRLVMMAKNTYVWLDQLSKKYQRPITRLDLIPDEELEQLADWGFTGLWLIGLWERSRASARIKQLCGNPEAIASAYSLREYRIADDLGGEEALKDLHRRAWRYGIRMASDMVPNHMAIDSKWVYEHPDWFIHLPYSPFPAYRFDGPNLSDDERGDIHIEDHYFSRSDAAVVFKYYQKKDGRTFYIYHGNDGTSMPWNDTAQLNYLNPQVREAVIQTILEVARRFPVIRFDAAMTLAKRHYQRLWYPQPGGGCDVPSRSEFGLTAEEFNQYLPNEFWREVVDRVAAEAPDTLLLAEAFWLMEGYFVRTLGMHRVYNSAFMNLLRDEDNAKYRQVMKNTMEFDPEILKRFVNFMNNPDEHTAASQFGKGDKYFGICTMMVTMPGLPMFGHGQIEGFTEKYGMEYKRAYWDEYPDEQLINRHFWQIFPLLKRRYLFAGVDHFYLYDFYTAEGLVDENVFAYSNMVGNERSLVVYHNRFNDTSGWVRISSAFMDKSIGALRQADLSEGLNLPVGHNQYLIFRDHLNGLDYIRNCHEIGKKGLFLHLDAYRAHVFLDFQIVEDDAENDWRHVHDHLNGRGVNDIFNLHWELPLQPVLRPLREIANSGYFDFLLRSRPQSAVEEPPDFLLNEADHKLHNLITGAAEMLARQISAPEICEDFKNRIRHIFRTTWLDELMLEMTENEKTHEEFAWMREKLVPERWLAFFCWAYLDCMRLALEMDVDKFLDLTESWRIFAIIESSLWEMDQAEVSAGDLTRCVKLIFYVNQKIKNINRRGLRVLWQDFICEPFIREYLHINEYDGTIWFGKESFEVLMAVVLKTTLIDFASTKRQGRARLVERIQRLIHRTSLMRNDAEKSHYDLARFVERLAQSDD